MRRDPLPGDLRRHARPQSNRLPPLETGAAEEAPSANIGQGVTAGPNVVPISERPAEVDKGASGHWEGDLIIGARNQSSALTLVERSSGFQLVDALPNGYQADLVIPTLVRWVQTTPAEMCESLTWDRGSEMAHWQVLTKGWGLPVFFCDPHAPWQHS